MDNETKYFLANRIAQNVIRKTARELGNDVYVDEYTYSELPGLDADLVEELNSLVRRLLQVVGHVSFHEYRIKADGSIMTDEEFATMIVTSQPEAF